ncbi:ATP-binding protein [Lentisphaerota bacterium WC36G]|nr:response regulator [Lentisphaerae bacterium WC36]
MKYLNDSINDLINYLSVPTFVISLSNNRIVATNSRLDRKYPNLFNYGTKVELIEDSKNLPRTRFVSYNFDGKKLILNFQHKENAFFVLNYINENTIIVSELNSGITATRSFKVKDFDENDNFFHYESTPFHFNYTYDFAFNKWQLSNPEQLLENGIIHSLKDLENFSWREHICEEDRSGYDQAMKKINITGGNHEIHYRIITPHGSLVQVCDYCGVIQNNDGWPMIVGSIVSGERAFEEIYEAQQYAMTGKLIGGMVHDFKNLLSGIHNVIEWASTVSNEEKIVDALHKTLDYTNQANYLISNTLKLSTQKNNLNVGSVFSESANINDEGLVFNESNLDSNSFTIENEGLSKNKFRHKVSDDKNIKINDVLPQSLKNDLSIGQDRKNSNYSIFKNEKLISSREEFSTRTRALALEPLSDKVHFNLGSLIINLSDLIVRMVPESIVVMVEVEEDLPYIYGTRRELQNVLLNLCLNARDAMSEHGGELTIQLGSEQLVDTLNGEIKNNVVLTVKDTGCGMARKQYEKVLQPYYSNKKSGSGLGLWMVKNTVDSLDGKLIIKSKLGLGSTFIIKIPALNKGSVEDQKFFNSLSPINTSGNDIKNPSITSSQRARKLNVKKFKDGFNAVDVNKQQKNVVDEVLSIVKKSPKKILYIEDNELIRCSTANYLRSLGLEVFEAADGNQGEQIFNSNCSAIDFVIQDYILPGKGGRELFKSLKSVKRDVPILICSANPDNNAMQNILDDGACGLISKPFKFDDLLHCLVKEFRIC